MYTCIYIIKTHSLGYRPFMMVLQTQVTLLDKFVIQQESIPHLITTATAPNNSFQKPNQQNIMKVNEHIDHFPKNVCVKCVLCYLYSFI